MPAKSTNQASIGLPVVPHLLDGALHRLGGARQLPGQVDEGHRPAARQALARLANLTPGDFAALGRRQRVLAQATTLAGLLEMLAAESRLNPDGGRIAPGLR